MSLIPGHSDSEQDDPAGARPGLSRVQRGAGRRVGGCGGWGGGFDAQKHIREGAPPERMGSSRPGKCDGEVLS